MYWFMNSRWYLIVYIEVEFRSDIEVNLLEDMEFLSKNLVVRILIWIWIGGLNISRKGWL